MQKSVYITGIAGLIGSSLAKHFLLKGWHVTGCDSLVGGYESNVPQAIYWEKKDIKELDYLPTSDWWANKRSYDVVIHTAALAYEGLSVFSPALITDSIYSNTMKIASLAIKNGCGTFINCSSMARYGEIEPPFYEHDEPKPIDPYGLAKLHAEQQLTLLEDIYPNFKSYTVIPHNVCGAQQVYNDPYRNVLSIMVHQALFDLPLFIYGDGEQLRSFSHVDDCVKAIDILIERQPHDRLFNIGPSENEITINELAQKVIIATNSKSKIVHLDARPREVKEAYCSSFKSENELDYKAIKTVDDIIKDIIEFITLNGRQNFKYKLKLEIKEKNIPLTWLACLFGMENWEEQLKNHEQAALREKSRRN